MSIPEYLPILSAGSHRDPAEGACVMEYVSLLAGEEWSDSPACTHPVLAAAARTVNDRMTDDERPALVPLIGRLFGTAPGGTDFEQKRLAVRLAVWCARSVLHLVGDDRAAAEAAITAVEGWCEGTVTEQERRAEAVRSAAAYADAYAAHAAHAAYAAHAAHAAANDDAARAAYAAADAANAAAHATYAADSSRVAAWLTGLVDEYDRLTGRTEHRTVTPTDLAALIAATA